MRWGGGTRSPCPPAPCHLLPADGLARCIRAPCKQRNHGFLPSPLVLQSRQGPAGSRGRGGGVGGKRCWGCRDGNGDKDGDGDGDWWSLPGPASCIPTQLEGLRGSGRPQSDWGPCPGTALGDCAKVPSPETVPGAGGCCISPEPMPEARFTPFHHHYPTETQPLDWSRAATVLGCQQPPPAGVWGGLSPTRAPCFGPHPPHKPGWGPVPSSPSAGGTGTRRLCLTKQSSVFVLSHLPAAS